MIESGRLGRHRQTRRIHLLTTLLLTTLSCLFVSAGCSSDEDQVRELVTELASQTALRDGEALAFRAIRIQKDFRPALSESIDVDGSLLPPKRYDRDLVLRGLISMRGYRYADVALEALDVRVVSEAGHASVQGIAVLSQTQPGDLHAERMPFKLALEKVGSAWLITRAWFGASRQDAPEARP